MVVRIIFFIMRLILAIFLVFSSVFPAMAAERFPSGDFSALKETGKASVTQIIAPNTLGLSDGRIVHLTGLDFPDLYDEEQGGALAQTALRVLNDMLLGQEVRLYQTRNSKSGRVNRMQHHVVHLERVKGKAWVQGTLLSLGLARARTTRVNAEMAAQMFLHEIDAREEKRGLWVGEAYNILDAADIDESALNHYQIVQGRVKNVTINKNRTFINFGDNWRDDFTAVIEPSDRGLFERAGIDPMLWKGNTIRVRGWLGFYNGPNMEIDHPQGVEVLTR